VIDIHLGDNLDVLRRFPDRRFDLIYIDPPFNTGSPRRLTRTRTVRDDTGDRTGFQQHRYRTLRLDTRSYPDTFDDYIGFLEPRLREAHRVLASTGSLFVHLDVREVHYVKVLLDQIFGRPCFQNEIIWAYDYGARSTTRWPAKHDNILWYSRDPARYTFRLDDADRIAYMAPQLVGPAKAARGKTPTDTWWHTIVSPTGKERTGYPTQKPVGILERIVKVHSDPGAMLCDFFAGSGSFGDAADRHGRDVVLIDSNPEAIDVMRRRFAGRNARFPSTLTRRAR
jgi:site-specific DNA-methyltransferase (adenine-specific)